MTEALEDAPWMYCSIKALDN
ncbi:protein of unknown function [Thauera humireducens]|nr:protein of unknown function [Thauera humireducens]